VGERGITRRAGMPRGIKKLKTRKLCYRKDIRAMHNPTIRTWFEARKCICTI